MLINKLNIYCIKFLNQKTKIMKIKFFAYCFVFALTNNLVFAQSEKDTTLLTKNLKEVYIHGKRLNEMQLVGEYDQPVWSTFRKFPTTRIYVQVPPGQAMYEKWMEIRDNKGDKGTEIRMRDEFAFGLGKRLELDLYLYSITTGSGENATLNWRAFSWEIRYALADWGKIFGNPTLYFEYLYMNGDYNKIEHKLLLGGNINDYSIWGVNFIYEGQLANNYEKDEELSVTASYSRILSNHISLGASYQYVTENEREGGEDNISEEHLLGPSFQLKLHDRAYLDVEPLIGLTKESKKSKTFIIFGWRF